MASGARVFSITELRRTGAGVLEATPVTFLWDGDTHSSPHTEIELPYHVGTVREEYGDRPVEQVLTTSWQPFSLHGAWDDKWAGRDFAWDTFVEFGKLVARASLVRIEFEQISLTGLLTDFVSRYQRRSHIEWDITFSPHWFGAEGASVRAPGVITQPVARPMREHSAIVTFGVTSLDSDREAAEFVPIADTLRADVNADVSALGSIAAQIQEATSAGLETEATQKLLALSSMFASVRGGAQNLIDTTARARSDVQVAFDDIEATLAFEVWMRDTRAHANITILDADAAERDMLSRAQAAPLAVHRPAVGESLYAISQRYYGTPNEWRRIYEFNRLSSLALTGTVDLIIPARVA